MTRKDYCKRLERELGRMGWSDVYIYPEAFIDGGDEKDYEKLYNDLMRMHIRLLREGSAPLEYVNVIDDAIDQVLERINEALYE